LINGKINGTEGFLCNDYMPRKKAGAKKKELHKELKHWVDDFYETVTYPLQTDYYRIPGFAVFLVGASTHLALLQEMAMVDPDAASPQASSYAQSVMKQAGDYLNMAKSTWNDILKKRLGFVELKADTGSIVDNSGSAFIDGSLLDHSDSVKNPTIWWTNDWSEWVINSNDKFNNYTSGLTTDLSTGLAGSEGINALFGRWQALTSNPFPETPSQFAPLYRSADDSHAHHIFTNNSLDQFLGWIFGLKPDGTCCRLLAYEILGSAPLYAAIEGTNELLTLDSKERDLFVNVFNFVDKGVAGYAYSTQQSGTIPLYRIYNDANKDHFYTTDPAEKDDYVRNRGYRDERITGYVYSAS
jgi:hypothetical protein